MKKALLLVLIISLIISIFSCKDTPDITDETTVGITEETTAQITTEVDEIPFELYTAHNGIQSDDAFDKVYTWGNYGYERNYVWSNKPIYNVSLLYIASDTELEWDLGRESEYTLEVLMPGEAVCLDIMVPEGFPSHAFCYEYEGEKHIMAIGYNGRDGGITFSEITDTKISFDD